MKNILSVDVEDWFNILDVPSTPKCSEWNQLESHVKKNFHTLLHEFDQTGVKVTCFFLGWVAERFPELVEIAYEKGHEIASHGYAHELIFKQSRQAFADDISRTKEILESISGQAVTGYRAPGFSIIKDTMWVFEELVDAGYQYDSSIFPAFREHGGIADAVISPYRIQSTQGSIQEFPLSVVRLFNQRICFFGGGYLRLFPYSIIKRMAKRVNQENRPVIYYIHPREIDPDHPRLPMGWRRRFMS